MGVGEEDGIPVGAGVGLADGVGLVVGVAELVGAGDGVITVGFAVGVGVGVGGGPSKTPGWRSVGIPWVSSQASPMPSPSMLTSSLVVAMEVAPVESVTRTPTRPE